MDASRPPLQRPRRGRKPFGRLFIIAILLVGGVVGYKQFITTPTVEERIETELSYDQSIDPAEQRQISAAISAQDITLSSSATISARTDTAAADTARTLDVYVPVTHVYAVRQGITTAELAADGYAVDGAIGPAARASIAETFGAPAERVRDIDLSSEAPAEADVVFTSVSTLDPNVHKLLQFDGVYYLDSFSAGALFRSIDIQGEGAGDLTALQLDTQVLSAADVYKVNMSGVTALTRIMMRQLATVGGDPLYFSQSIGEFLADADLTHVSNEVSFVDGCSYSNTLFCSPPEFLETLKASGVDLVELTGNHNNDFGAQVNAETIALYRELGWDTYGGGLNTADAAEPVIKTQKDSTIAFLAYNFPDSPNGVAIAGSSTAGANSYDETKVKQDITSAKEQADFVIVNIQYWECAAYPDSYVEYPECDKPIGQQEATFKTVVDLGADMVIGSSAHQPQTYEVYNGAPIYYGLGNLYFDQYQWPGTERGIILTHYFAGGRLLQTKLTPTVYSNDLQTRLMTADETQYLMTRLRDAR